MENARYMISDAANIVNVESHVLRYWEEELELAVPRNEMGHRYYTEENIAQFQKIKEWKEQGYQLKAIRMMIHNIPESRQVVQAGREYPEMEPPYQIKEHNNSASNTVKLEQFRVMMTTIVKQAMEENNSSLSKEVGVQVGEKVLKEMNYLMREQDEAEEERFRKLDAAIRSQQKGRRFRKEKTAKKEKEKDSAKIMKEEKKLNPNLTT
ncbi:MAG: MerR family transcriptional regulator [Lachnospiraceae bacterium]|nr:MerR family transcriptional regulator [Lachnospiraceae bacterium]